MLSETTDPSLWTRNCLTLMDLLPEAYLDLARDDPIQDRPRLLDQAEVEAVRYLDFHFRRQRRTCIQQ